MSYISWKKIQVELQCACISVCMCIATNSLVMLIILNILFSIMLSFTYSSLLNNVFDEIVSYSKASASIYFFSAS